MRYIGILIVLAAGAGLTAAGWLIWKKRRISLIHPYHWARVPEAQKGAYTKAFGRAVMVLGAFVLICGIAGWFDAALLALIFPGVLLWIPLIVSIQKKYNG